MKPCVRLSLLFFLLLLTACSSSPEQQATLTATTQAQPASTATPISVSTATTAPTATAAATATSRPTNTITPTVVLTPSLVSMGTSNPSLVPETRRISGQGNSFSLVPPSEWSHVYFNIMGGDTDGWVPPDGDPTEINIGTLLLSISMDIDQLKADWVVSLKEKSPDYVQIREDHLISDAGQEYLRWEVSYTGENGPQHSVYSFYRSKTWNLVVIYLRPEAQGSEYDILVDETLKTVKLSD